ncbi:MAG: Ig-like domain-containing protein [Gemmatimonadaceae bacterium]
MTGVAAGTATITAASEGKSGTFAVTITPAPVASVTVSGPSTSVVKGATLQLTAVTKDAGGNTLTGRTIVWSSSATTITTVDAATGLVTGVAGGRRRSSPRAREWPARSRSP